MKKLREYTVVIQYNVQKTYTVSAKNKEEAEKFALNGKGYSERSDEDWEYEEIIEIKEIE